MQLYEAEIVYRAVGDPMSTLGKQLNAPEKVVKLVTPMFAGTPHQEQLLVVFVDTRMKPLGVWRASLGGLNCTVVCCKTLMRAAILSGCMGIVMTHNHPSGDPSPSVSDQKVTKTIADACELLEIKLHDHVIVGRPEDDPNLRGYYSFQEEGAI